MLLTYLAKGDVPNIADWLAGWGAVAAAVIALGAMIVSIVFAVKSGSDAKKASDSLQKIANAQSQHQADRVKSEARNVAVQPTAVGGKQGLAVRNGNQAAHVYELRIDFVHDTMVQVISAGRSDFQTAPVSIPVLAPNETTAVVYQRQQAEADVQTLVEQARLRFRDSRAGWWERIGNGEPVPIDRHTCSRCYKENYVPEGSKSFECYGCAKLNEV